MNPLGIVVIAPLRFPIRQPFAGGLESAVWNEVRLLRRHGHRVSFIATAGSDFLEGGPADFVLPAPDWGDDRSAADDTYPDGYLDRVLPALDRALDVVRANASEVDVVVNHCLHGLPLERAGSLTVPMVSTLHTPVVPELVQANAACVGRQSRFLSVSSHTAGVWREAGIDSTVLANGVDPHAWRQGSGGSGLVWSGRFVPEKAPHLAVDAARLLGRPITLAGRIGDRGYFDAEIAPRLGPDVTYAGSLGQEGLARLIGSSGCALVTPVWDEPFGLVIPEALLCGTPVAGFGAGGVTEIAGATDGVATVPVGEVAALADAADGLLARSAAEPRFRDAVRAGALARFSLTARLRQLEEILQEVIDVGSAETGRPADRVPA